MEQKSITKEALKIFLLGESRTRETLGTSLAGSIECSFASLVSLLGEPTSDGDRHKIDAKWELEMDGKILTIYNYKDGINYNGEANGLLKKDLTDWHIGAKEDVDVQIGILQKTLAPELALNALRRETGQDKELCERALESTGYNISKAKEYVRAHASKLS